jgi:hypothetical protein
MFARLTRFEGSEPAKLKEELAGMRDQMQRGLSDESIDQMAEQVKGQFERDEVARLLGAIKRTIVLADAEKGSSAMVLFCETEEDAHGVDRLFDAMSPGEGGGRRESADIYAVAIDQTFST